MQVNNFNPTFCGYKCDFSKKLEAYITKGIKNETEEKNLIDTFTRIMPEKITPENIIGKGFHGIVYGLDDDYVFKVEQFSFPNIGKDLLIGDNILQKLKTYYGSAIAKIGDIKIMKNAFKTKDVLEAGLPDRLMSISEKKDYYNNVYLRRFAALPQSSYDRIAQDFKTLNSIGKEFDTINPNNFSVDGDEIKIIDEITNTEVRNPNNLAKLLRVFTNSYDANQAADFDNFAVQNRKVLFKKLILASEKAGLPFSSSLDDCKELEMAMNLCDYKVNFSEIKRTLTEYRRIYPDMNIRLQKISEFLDEFDQPDIYTAMFYN